MNQKIKKEILNNLDDVYTKIIDNNKSSEEIIKILSLIDKLQNEIGDINLTNKNK